MNLLIVNDEKRKMKTFEAKKSNLDNTKIQTHWAYKNFYTSMYRFIEKQLSEKEEGWAIMSINRID